MNRRRTLDLLVRLLAERDAEDRRQAERDAQADQLTHDMEKSYDEDEA